ncbi:endolytic peptidoglycan transglycosylase RlpA [Malaciobacter pacificus]|uniref:Probable endolytic peptidoglycan transglycosylase RlpA n=1 Tax=Malaciobacter pacificus TaxID=1080223 RepID=A0A5C2HC39_9BACT|nr:septal ring lytic transglycosylase RlpA family protein [Malaciobacter pacificus]QEP34364.1 septal ring lytic transglycosylase [Malaciobacter pacificus]GGD38116.1 endolytic peptidoglycan transglycosylase RlpA [Malaciobacter pacificus]
MSKNNNLFFQSIVATVILGVAFSGCSSKKTRLASNTTINKFYKDTNNTKIKNSRNMHKYTLRPYSVFGIKYYPFVANVGDEFTGIASWYGPDFHAKKTSNGETYNMYALTAAHKTLPMNTVVRVDNLENGKSVIVRINDRGPFVKGRIIDLSNKAAHAIDMVRKGTAKVKVTVLGYNGEINNHNAPTVAHVKQIPVETKPKVIDVGEAINPTTIEENTVTPSSVGAYNIQVGAFSKAQGAIETRDKFQSLYPSNKVEAKREFTNGQYFYKVFIKGFSTKTDAEVFKLENGLNSSMIVKD